MKGKDIKDLKVFELKKELAERGLTVLGNKNNLFARLEDFLLKQEGVKCCNNGDDDWDSEAERSLNPGNQSVLDEFIYVLKSEVDSDHKKIEHLNAEVEHLKLQCKAKVDGSSDLSEVIKDQNSKNERPSTSQGPGTCTECKDLLLDIAKIKLELHGNVMVCSQH